MIYVTGDTHGCIDIKKCLADITRLGSDHTTIVPVENLTEDDYLIICGDFGLVWYTPDNLRWIKQEMTLKSLNYQKFTTLFVDGNHENFDFLNSYPVEDWNGGKVQFIKDKVIHLCRGEVYNISGVSIFAMGGATSHDAETRTPHVSWWDEELPSSAEYENALSNLDKVAWSVDYVISHCAPYSIVTTFKPEFTDSDSELIFFDTVLEKLKFKHWYFGHYHEDEDVGSKFTCLYRELIQIGNSVK
jgi:hypothetical protein